METGKHLRLKRIFHEDSRAFIVVMDHAAIAGPMANLENPSEIIGKMASGGADALLITRGMLEKGRESVRRDMGIILRISGGFTLLTDPAKFEDRIISSVDTALKLGADGVAVTIKFGHHKEGQFIEHASMIGDICRNWGMPLLVEVMAVGQRAQEMGIGKSLSIACRSAFESGADLVKTHYPGNKEDFHKMVKGCPAPIVILGGEKMDSLQELFQMIKDSIDAGGAGIAMGRNVWECPAPYNMATAMSRLIHENISIEEALNIAGG